MKIGYNFFESLLLQNDFMARNLKKNKEVFTKILLRKPSEVMKLSRLGSFHQSRLSFSRQLINEMKQKEWKFHIAKWNIDNEGVGNAVINVQAKKDVFSLVIFCHSIKDEERSDRVIAEKWDMTIDFFLC